MFLPQSSLNLRRQDYSGFGLLFVQSSLLVVTVKLYLRGEETHFPALSRCLLTPLIASPFEPNVLNILPITGLAVATVPSTA